MFQGFMGAVSFLPQQAINELPKDKKEALRQKLGPSHIDVTNISNNIQDV